LLLSSASHSTRLSFAIWNTTASVHRLESFAKTTWTGLSKRRIT
jgi:hypothetical protein